MHKPVLLAEVLHFLKPKEGEVYIDCTFGAGGYTRAILQSAECKVIAFDRDSTTIATAEKLKQEFGERFIFVNDTFSHIQHYVEKADAIIADFGISSMQVDEVERGFSFQKEARLNMQMGKCEISAFEVVNEFSEEEIAEIIFKYSNERLAKKIAGMIYHERKKSKIETTVQLANIIYEAYGKPRHYKIHPATKTFQAIRIFVNNELEEIQLLLEASKKVLNKGGRLICVSFHELEDRLVKDFLNENSPKREKNNKYLQTERRAETLDFEIITKKPVEPSKHEVLSNVRARSAKVRCGLKI